jgi:4-amino-4-deoxy-L-arabinose transferase-like glycosyltransferase
LLAWSIGVWLVFEIVPTKLPHYVLPVYPALALICALWVDRDHMEGGQSSKAWRIASAILFLVGAAAAAAACIYLPMRYGGNVRAPLLFGAAIAGALACAAATTFLQTRFRQAVELALASAIAFDLVLGIVDVPQLRDLWLSPRAAELAAAERGPGNSPIVLTGYVEPSLVFLLGSDTRIAPARQAAAAISKGGLALVESRALPEFLAGATSLDVMTKPLGNVRGLDYSTGRNEQITLFRVMPAGH